MSRFITKGFEVLEDDGSVTKDYFIRDRETGLAVEERLMRYQLVGVVKAHQG